MREMAPRKNSFLKVTPNEIVLRNEKKDNVGILDYWKVFPKSL